MIFRLRVAVQGKIWSGRSILLIDVHQEYFAFLMNPRLQLSSLTSIDLQRWHASLQVWLVI